MWLFLSDGFLSIVAHRSRPNHLLVRSRKRDHLTSIFPEADYFYLEYSDYPHRAVIERELVAKIISERLNDIDYDNFKNSIDEQKYANSGNKIWELMFDFGIKFRG